MMLMVRPAAPQHVYAAFQRLLTMPREEYAGVSKILTEVASGRIKSRSSQTEYNIVHSINFRDTPELRSTVALFR